MHRYIKKLAILKDLPIRGIYQDAVEEFIIRKPWTKGLRWKHTKPLSVPRKDEAGRNIWRSDDWIQINIRVSIDAGLEIEKLAITSDESICTVTYTILYWYCWDVYSPKESRVRQII